jgi:hypothetical protein
METTIKTGRNYEQIVVNLRDRLPNDEPNEFTGITVCDQNGLNQANIKLNKAQVHRLIGALHFAIKEM